MDGGDGGSTCAALFTGYIELSLIEWENKWRLESGANLICQCNSPVYESLSLLPIIAVGHFGCYGYFCLLKTVQGRDEWGMGRVGLVSVCGNVWGRRTELVTKRTPECSLPILICGYCFICWFAQLVDWFAWWSTLSVCVLLMMTWWWNALAKRGFRLSLVWCFAAPFVTVCSHTVSSASAATADLPVFQLAISDRQLLWLCSRLSFGYWTAFILLHSCPLSVQFAASITFSLFPLNWFCRGALLFTAASASAIVCWLRDWRCTWRHFVGSLLRSRAQTKPDQSRESSQPSQPAPVSAGGFNSI